MNGPAVVFMRNDATGTWISHNLGFTNHAFDYAQIRSMGFHRDKIWYLQEPILLQLGCMQGLIILQV
jgi:hypothetical protein